MKVKVPQNIKVLTHNYKVIFNPHLWHDTERVGEADHRLQVISIDPVLSKSERNVCLIHELLELIKRNYTLDLKHDDLERLAQTFMQFLADLGIEFDWQNIS